jgi:hypothetical protein
MERRLIFDTVVDKIKSNKTLRESGKDICIPFPFTGLSKYSPGIEQGNYYLITGNQKSAKTQIADFLFLYNAVRFVTERETNIKVKIFDFNLEMSKESKLRQAIVYRLFIKKGITLSIRELNSVYSDRILPDYILRFVEEDRAWFELFEGMVEFIDDIRNPYGIYDHVRNFFKDNGTYTYRKIKVTDKDGSTKEVDIVDNYTPKDPDLYTLIMVDNANLLLPEKGGSLFDAIGKLSSDYMVRARNRWNAIPVIIQQQSLGKEGNESVKMARTEPSSDGLADNKVTSKDCDTMITIYSPLRNKIQRYPGSDGYDITKLKDNYRRVAVELDRYGTTCETSLYFNGAVNYFKELPPPAQMTNEIYDRIKNGNINAT